MVPIWGSILQCLETPNRPSELDELMARTRCLSDLHLLAFHHPNIGQGLSRTLQCTRTAKQCGRAQSMVSQLHVNVDLCGNGRAQSAALLIGQVRVMVRAPHRANLTKATGK